MNLAVEDSKGFRDHADGQRLLVAPSFSWQLDPDTRCWWKPRWCATARFDRGTVAPHNHSAASPRSRFFGEPDDGKIDNNNETLQATLRHHFNEQWSLRLASHYKHGHLDGYASENPASPPTATACAGSTATATSSGTTASPSSTCSATSIPARSATSC
ncbi:hypothetical protein ACPA9J_04375 [Pseudomonas aeruginosa]